MKITIIVPVYNVEKYLKDCIDSILQQTFTDYELILVDDGSPDNSGQICDDYAHKDKRIKVIHKNNGGLSSARNAGLNLSIGEYITFIDSDDLIKKDYLKKVFDIVLKENIDVLSCQFYRFKNSLELNLEEQSDLKYEIMDKYTAMGELINNSELNFSACTKIFRRDLFKYLKFNEIRIYEDMDIMYRIIDKASKIAIVYNSFYCYRITPNSILTSNFNQKHLIEYDIRKEMYDYYSIFYPQLSYNVYANWMFVSYLMYVKITRNERNKQKYKYLLKFDKKIIKKANILNLLPNIRFGVKLFKISPLLLIIAFKLKY